MLSEDIQIFATWLEQGLIGPEELSQYSVYVLKRKATAMTAQKQAEKEIRWEQISEEHKPLYRAAEEKQWQEHLTHDALEPLTVEESRRIESEVDSSRILPMRFAYRDKNAGLRAAGSGYEEVPLKLKARLVCGGHLDPDVTSGVLKTDAPTIGRLSLHLFLVISRQRGWAPCTADVEAALFARPSSEWPLGTCTYDSLAAVSIA
jgi:hypothetical protein